MKFIAHMWNIQNPEMEITFLNYLKFKLLGYAVEIRWK